MHWGQRYCPSPFSFSSFTSLIPSPHRRRRLIRGQQSTLAYADTHSHRALPHLAHTYIHTHTHRLCCLKKHTIMKHSVLSPFPQSCTSTSFCLPCAWHSPQMETTRTKVREHLKAKQGQKQLGEVLYCEDLMLIFLYVSGYHYSLMRTKVCILIRITKAVLSGGNKSSTVIMSSLSTDWAHSFHCQETLFPGKQS